MDWNEPCLEVSNDKKKEESLVAHQFFPNNENTSSLREDVEEIFVIIGIYYY